MIDRGAVLAEVRNWAEEITGLGFSRADMQLWEEGVPEPLRPLTARGVATRSRRVPEVRIRSLSRPSQRCDRLLRVVATYDPRYRVALILYACAPSISLAADSIRRNAVDFGRFSEAGLALYAAHGKSLTTAVASP